MAKGGRSRPEGIIARHQLHCASATGASCDCRPSYQAQAYSPRDRRTIRKTFRSLADARAWRVDTKSALRAGTIRAPTRSLLETGANLWRKAGAETRTAPGYNLANAEFELWTLAVKADGFVLALESHRDRLHLARRLFERAGRDETLDKNFRVQALTNLGNSYDELGRDFDGLAAYEEALQIDPTFGMALGNKGVALVGIAQFMGEHVPAVLRRAEQALDGALKDKDRILAIGGRSALRHFEDERSRIKMATSTRTEAAPRWKDPHLRWCASHRLFLHVSPECLSEASDSTDPLFFRGVTTGLSDEDQERVKDLVDAFNVIK
jgi:tetratricopeptide (TPR) repeat protein